MLNTSSSLLENSYGYIWLNGKFVEWKNAKIHILTHSLHYSGSVFEGEKAFNGKIFRIHDHTDRLFRSAELLKLEIPYSKDEIIQASKELLSKNNFQNAYIRPLVWRSTEALMVRPVGTHINVMIAAWEPRRKPNSNPMHLMVSRWRKHSEDSYPIQCKSSSQYAMFVISIMEANEKGYEDALLLDPYGNIAECTTSNIFFIKQNKLFTPQISFCLNGITRQTIISIAESLCVEVYEADITTEDMHSFEACFITGTAIGLKDVGSITYNDRKISFCTHNLYDTLKSKYLDLVNGK